MFAGESRAAFRSAVGQDEGTWARARGWALWKALLNVAKDADTAENQRVVEEIFADR